MAIETEVLKNLEVPNDATKEVFLLAQRSSRAPKTTPMHQARNGDIFHKKNTAFDMLSIEAFPRS